MKFQNVLAARRASIPRRRPLAMPTQVHGPVDPTRGAKSTRDAQDAICTRTREVHTSKIASFDIGRVLDVGWDVCTGSSSEKTTRERSTRGSAVALSEYLRLRRRERPTRRRRLPLGRQPAVVPFVVVRSRELSSGVSFAAETTHGYGNRSAKRKQITRYRHQLTVSSSILVAPTFTFKDIGAIIDFPAVPKLLKQLQRHFFRFVRSH